MSAQLQTPTNGTGTGQALAFSEAPASVNVFATSPAGFTYQLTMRAARVADVLSQAAQLEAWLTSHNWTPGKAPGKASQGDAANSVQSEAAPVCAIHGKPMTRRTTKDGTRSFWSCSERLSDGSYCPYRPPKQ